MSELTNALITYDDAIAKTNIDVLRKIAKVHDFAIFDKGNYNLNIWGIRCNTVDTGTFNDLLLVFYKANDANPKMNGKWTYDSIVPGGNLLESITDRANKDYIANNLDEYIEAPLLLDGDSSKITENVTDLMKTCFPEHGNVATDE